MRFVSAILFATGALGAGWASAQSPSGLPKTTLGDAGQAAAFAQFLCNTPGSEIDAFRRKVDELVQGGTGSAAYLAGEASARAVIDQVRRAGDGDTRELEATTCPRSETLVQKIIARP